MSNLATSAVAAGMSDMVNSMIAKEIARGALRPDAIKLALLEIGRIMFDPRGRAIRHLSHFLNNTGSPIELNWFELAKEDINVRRRVHAELVRRALGISTTVENITKNTPAQEDSSVITVFQWTYNIQDWNYALGTFPIQFEVVRPGASPEPFVTVKIWASNEYKWYSSEGRITQSVHKVADELIKARKARAFNMYIKPTQLTLPISSENLLYANAGFQNNPRAERTLLSSDQFRRARQTALDLGYSSALLDIAQPILTTKRGAK